MGRIKFGNTDLTLQMAPPVIKKEDETPTTPEMFSKEDVEKIINALKPEVKVDESLQRNIDIAHEKIDNVSEDLFVLTSDVASLEKKVLELNAQNAIQIPEVREVIIHKIDNSVLDDMNVILDDLEIEQTKMSDRLSLVESINKSLSKKIKKQDLLVKLLFSSNLVLLIILSLLK